MLWCLWRVFVIVCVCSKHSSCAPGEEQQNTFFDAVIHLASLLHAVSCAELRGDIETVSVCVCVCTSVSALL